MEMFFSAKVMGWFGATVQNYSEIWQSGLQVIEERFDPARPGPGKCTPREKDGVAVFREGVVGIMPGGPPFLITQDSVIGGKILYSHGNSLLPHCQKECCRVQSDFRRTAVCA